ncbi:MAG: hypothetical protein AAFR20_09155 [Pseudomonadota bacterium]
MSLTNLAPRADGATPYGHTMSGDGKYPSLADEPVLAAEVAQPFDRRAGGDRRGSGETSAGLSDTDWIEENLRRCEEEYCYLDLANILRVLERHPDYVGRFHYDINMHKVIDRGVTMQTWQVDALAGEIQERFLPGISEDLVHKSVAIVANKSALIKKVR